MHMGLEQSILIMLPVMASALNQMDMYFGQTKQLDSEMYEMGFSFDESLMPQFNYPCGILR